MEILVPEFKGTGALEGKAGKSSNTIGSTFKRKDGVITAKLIDECGLKGYKIGDAMVSEKHAGFIINLRNATAKDIIELINYVKDKIYENYGIIIEEEIKIIGEA